MRRFLLVVVTLAVVVGISHAILITKNKTSETKIQQEVKKESDEPPDTRTESIKEYFTKFNAPVASYSGKLIEEADKYSLDWRLLPAISMQESTGCKFRMGSNCFGFGYFHFSSIEEGIERVAEALSGQGPYGSYYRDKNTLQKLCTYNGCDYAKRVVGIMETIGQQTSNSS
jgi:hypothetical protein